MNFAAIYSNHQKKVKSYYYVTAHVYTLNFPWTLIYESGSRIDFVISPLIPFLKGDLQLCNIVRRKAKKEVKIMLLLQKLHTSINLWKQILKCLKS